MPPQPMGIIRENNWNTIPHNIFWHGRESDGNITWEITRESARAKIDLKDTDIPQGTGQKLLTLQQNYDDIVSKHSSNTRLTHLEEMTIDSDPNLSPVARKPYPLALKHHKLVKEEIENLLETGLIERSMSP